MTKFISDVLLLVIIMILLPGVIGLIGLIFRNRKNR